MGEDSEDSLRDVAEQKRRRILLGQPSVTPLAEYVSNLRVMCSGRRIPDFDPLDGGIGARALIVLESPGPAADGTGFVSRNNPDPTARRLCRLLRMAGIPRRDIAIWNLVPWYLGSRGKPQPDDKRAGKEHLRSLLADVLAPRIVVLAGDVAHGAQDHVIQVRDCLVLKTLHPADLAVAGRFHRERLLLRQLCTLRALLARVDLDAIFEPMPSQGAG